MCDYCNYIVHGCLHSIHHHLVVAHIFHTHTESADESVRRGFGVGVQPRCLNFSKLIFRVDSL